MTPAAPGSVTFMGLTRVQRAVYERRPLPDRTASGPGTLDHLQTSPSFYPAGRGVG